MRKSKEADRVREAKARKDLEELQKEEEARGSPAGVSTYRFRSLFADQNLEMLERIGDLADKSRGMSIGQLTWFDSDLCILEPTNSIQLAALKQLKVTGLLCSRYSASVQGVRRFFALAEEVERLPNGREETGGEKQGGQLQQPPVSLAVPDPEGGGSQAAAEVAADPETAPKPTVAEARKE